MLMYTCGLHHYANTMQMKFTSEIVALLKWIVLKVKQNQVKMLKLHLLYLFCIMLRSWTSELKSATGTKSQPLGLIACYSKAITLNRIVYPLWKLQILYHI